MPRDSAIAPTEGPETAQDARFDEGLDPDPDYDETAIAPVSAGSQLVNPVDVLAVGPDISEEALAAYRRAGIDPTAIETPDSGEFAGEAFNPEELCDQLTTWPGAVAESRLMVLLDLRIYPDEEKYPGYKGFLAARCIHPERGEILLTHAYSYRQTGELTPIAKHLTQTMGLGQGFVIAQIRTNQGFHVYKPIPGVRR